MSDKISMNSDCKERRYYSVTWQVLIFFRKVTIPPIDLVFDFLLPSIVKKPRHYWPL